MVLKNLLALMIFGIVLLIVGFFVLQSSVNMVLEKYPTTSILFVGDKLEPGQSLRKALNMTSEEEFVIVLDAQPEDVPIYLVFSKPDETVAIETIFNERLDLPIYPNSSGIYSLAVGNMGKESVVVGGFTFPSDFRQDEDIIGRIVMMETFAMILVVTGFVLFLISIILLIIKKIKQKIKK